MNYRKDQIAKEYYDGLLALKNFDNDIIKRLYRKVCKVDRDKFIEEYPISTLNIVSYRTFWDLLLQLDIVKNPFHVDQSQSDEFECKLKNIIESLIYDKSTNYSVNDIIYVFKKYKVSA